MDRFDITPDDLTALAALKRRYGTLAAALAALESKATKPQATARGNLTASAAMTLWRRGVLSRREMRSLLGLPPKGWLACRLT